MICNRSVALPKDRMSQAFPGAAPDADFRFESMGLLRSNPNGLAPWSMPPGWQSTGVP